MELLLSVIPHTQYLLRKLLINGLLSMQAHIGCCNKLLLTLVRGGDVITELTSNGLSSSSQEGYSSIDKISIKRVRKI